MFSCQSCQQANSTGSMSLRTATSRVVPLTRIPPALTASARPAATTGTPSSTATSLGHLRVHCRSRSTLRLFHGSERHCGRRADTYTKTLSNSRPGRCRPQCFNRSTTLCADDNGIPSFRAIAQTPNPSPIKAATAFSCRASVEGLPSLTPRNLAPQEIISNVQRIVGIELHEPS